MDNTTKIRIAHSPDSDDAFMFYALTQGLVDTGGLEVEHRLRLGLGLPAHRSRCMPTPIWPIVTG